MSLESKVNINRMPTRKPNSLIPSNDQKRLAKLYEYEIIDTSPEDEFDKIAKLAATIFDCPSAFITFVDTDTVFFKSNISKLPENKVPRKDSLCSLTILGNEVTVIEDASQFNDLMESPFVCQPGGIRFYAGAPLITPEGYKLGSICVIDDKPRTPTAAQLSILSELSTLVMDKLETRAANKKTMEIQTEYINRSVHDLKTYLANLLLATDLLKHANLENKFRGLPETISRNAHNLSDRMDSMLNLSRIESSAYTLFIQSCNISEQLDKVIDNYSAVSNNKGQQIVKQYGSDIVINADYKAINEIFENLFSNALKYSFLNSSIVISATGDSGSIIIGFHDEGQGLTENDMQNLFIRYAKLSSIPTGKESSTGMGLTIAKILVELHSGRIWAESKGKNMGTTFFISLSKNIPIIFHPSP